MSLNVDNYRAEILPVIVPGIGIVVQKCRIQSSRGRLLWNYVIPHDLVGSAITPEESMRFSPQAAKPVRIVLYEKTSAHLAQSVFALAQMNPDVPINGQSLKRNMLSSTVASACLSCPFLFRQHCATKTAENINNLLNHRE